MTHPLELPDINQLVDRYLGGVSMKQLADERGVSRPTLTTAFRKRGVDIRGRSDAERLKWSRADRTVVERQLAAAWQAARGRHDGPDALALRAASRCRRLGRFEAELGA